MWNLNLKGKMSDKSVKLGYYLERVETSKRREGEGEVNMIKELHTYAWK
jgi:hypothetical protein